MQQSQCPKHAWLGLQRDNRRAQAQKACCAIPDMGADIENTRAFFDKRAVQRVHPCSARGVAIIDIQ
jgi:hypothetical protein